MDLQAAAAEAAAGADAPVFDIYRGDGGNRGDAAATLPDQPPVLEERGEYVAAPELAEAVNIALTVGQPLLVTGEPGCGKTRLAWSVAKELQLPAPLVFNTRSTSHREDLLYRYDAVRRFYDIQRGDPRAASAEAYVEWQPLGIAIRAHQRMLVLIDEIDKAPRDFPNDLLLEIERMRFSVPELAAEFESKVRPIVIITSNTERQLPLPFLRRCVYYHIDFPGLADLRRIVEQRLGPWVALNQPLVETALQVFLDIRSTEGISKKPGTSELLAWLHSLHVAGVPSSEVRTSDRIRLWQVLIKDREDAERFLPAR